jgi:hypothetical protein
MRANGCRFWLATTRVRGPKYGVFSYEGTAQPAHRIAWMISHRRDIPTGMAVTHACDNPQCVRSRHLRLKRIHEDGGRPRTFDWAKAVRLVRNGHTQLSAAEKLGVSQSAVSRAWQDHITRTST